MTDQKVNYPVSLSTADLVVSLASKKQNSFKLMMGILREIEEEIEIRRKLNLKYYQISTIAESLYNKEIYSRRQLSNKSTGEIKFLENDVYQLGNQREVLKQELEIQEQELNEVRNYADQRKDKKAKREKQYHNFYNVPIVAAQYKKKYVRARDKNSDAEKQMSNVRSAVDSIQKAIGDKTKSINDSQKSIEALTLQKQEAEIVIKHAESMVVELKNGYGFWSGFDKHQLPDAIRATQNFIQAIQKHARKTTTGFSEIVHNDSDFVKFFRLALSEYAEAESYAESRWGSIQIPFECAKCHTSQTGWPNLDKVRTTDLLCDLCYKETRTSMILEKKFNGLMGAGGAPSLQSRNSNLSISSIDTNNSSTATNNKSKNGFKKIFQKIKINKHPNSSSDLDQDFVKYPHNLSVV
ncbi:hypothetical protein BY458DRAFT_523841 [Sporodiniella umbellata]|nr:hypothetical protein BY458DRAFT_523841 [Sporodiniella umbellata]